MMRTIQLAMCVAVIAAAGPVQAGVTSIFTDRTAWEAAVGSVVTEDFESAPLGFPAAAVNNDLGLVDFFYDIGPLPYGPEIVDSGAVNGSREFDGHVFTPGQSGGGTTAPTLHRFTFPFSITAWGADFYSSTTGDYLQVSVAGDLIEFDNHLTGGGNGFFGVVSDTTFTEITFATEDVSGVAAAEFFHMDNLSFEESSAVPEPSTFALLGIGCVCMGVIGAQRRRKIKTA